MELTKNTVSFEENIRLDGFYECNGDMFLFIDVTQEKLNLNDIYSDSIIRFALVDEIINHQHICNIKIDENVTHFLNSNMDFILL